MILILRGHIRNSFDDSQLYNFIKYLSQIYILEIYIHTWSIKQNNVSWRIIDNDYTEINTKYIENYFKDLFKFVKKIIIEDETNINLLGNLNGKILSTKTFIIGWKRYIYGQYKILDLINNLNENKNVFVINTRFDLFTNSYIFSFDEIINFINNNYNTTFTKNIFLRNGEYCGIDNIILGNISTNFLLFSYINFNLDKIILHKDNKNLIHPEFIVSRVNNLFF
jgi:hypothetical protein